MFVLTISFGTGVLDVRGAELVATSRQYIWKTEMLWKGKIVLHLAQSPA